MFFLLKGLKAEYKTKDIFVWNVNWSSMRVFLDLGLHGINICGFVAPDDAYMRFEENEKFIFNRPIISLTDFLKKNNSLLIAYENVASIYSEEIKTKFKWYFIDEILDINTNLKEKNVYIYGIGSGADKIFEELTSKGIEVKNFCISSKPVNLNFKSKLVKEYKKSDFNTNDAMIISVIREDFKNEILDILQDFPGDVYIKSIDDELWKYNTLLPHVLQKAIEENRKVYLCSAPDLYINILQKLCEIYGIEISGRVYLEEYENPKIEDIYSLAEENLNEICVLVNERNKKKLCQIITILRGIGFSSDIPNIDGLQFCLENEKMLNGTHRYIRDILLGGTMEFNRGEFVMWKLWEAANKFDISIMIVGGSTSHAELYEPETWMVKLGKILQSSGINAKLYIGGRAGANVVYEYLALIRDIVAINPNIVISMSGVNNVISYYKYKGLNLNQFNIEVEKKYKKNKDIYIGLPINESMYDFWLRVEKMMRLYCKSIGVEFFGFLQPMNCYMENMSLKETMQFEREEAIIGGKEFYKNAVNNEIYINLLKLFEHKVGMIWDYAHYTDAGAKILAEKVAENIIPAAKEIIKNKGMSK